MNDDHQIGADNAAKFGVRLGCGISTMHSPTTQGPRGDSHACPFEVEQEEVGRREDRLDEALDESFPASDVPAVHIQRLREQTGQRS